MGVVGHAARQRLNQPGGRKMIKLKVEKNVLQVNMGRFGWGRKEVWKKVKSSQWSWPNDDWKPDVLGRRTMRVDRGSVWVGGVGAGGAHCPRFTGLGKHPMDPICQSEALAARGRWEWKVAAKGHIQSPPNTLPLSHSRRSPLTHGVAGEAAEEEGRPGVKGSASGPPTSSRVSWGQRQHCHKTWPTYQHGRVQWRRKAHRKGRVRCGVIPPAAKDALLTPSPAPLIYRKPSTLLRHYRKPLSGIRSSYEQWNDYKLECMCYMLERVVIFLNCTSGITIIH